MIFVILIVALIISCYQWKNEQKLLEEKQIKYEYGEMTPYQAYQKAKCEYEDLKEKKDILKAIGEDTKEITRKIQVAKVVYNRYSKYKDWDKQPLYLKNTLIKYNNQLTPEELNSVK